MQASELHQAVKVLQQGGVVAHATEGVWGLACDPWNEVAVHRILAIKQRSIEHGLIVIGSEATTFQEELDILTPGIQRKVIKSWPGHVTWILPTRRFPHWVTGNRDSVAARVPDHEQARSIAQHFGKPIISTSANISGEEPATTMKLAYQEFSTLVDLVVPGEIGSAVGPSRILNALNEDTIR